MADINKKRIHKIFKAVITAFLCVCGFALGCLLLYEPDVPLKEKLYAIYAVVYGDKAYDERQNISAFEDQKDAFYFAAEFIGSNYENDTALTIQYAPQREQASDMDDALYAALDQISRGLEQSTQHSFSWVALDKAKIVFGFDGNPIAYVYSQNGKKPEYLQEYNSTRKALGEGWFYFSINPK